MENAVGAGIVLAILSGVMNGTFTTPMRFLGRWEWENVWAVFIFAACVLLPGAMISFTAPQSWSLIVQLPLKMIVLPLAFGIAWGFGSIMFGQSVSAIGISLANTFVLAVSSALGSLVPLLVLTPHRLFERSGLTLVIGVAIELVGIVLCGRAGMMRERSVGTHAGRGKLVGKARPLSIALLLVIGSGILSAVMNIGFSLSQPIATFGMQRGLSSFASTNLIWFFILGGGAISNMSFCTYLMVKNRTYDRLAIAGSSRLYILCMVMAMLWGGSIFVYGAAVPRLGSLGSSIGWPFSLATGLFVANAMGIFLGEWKLASKAATRYLFGGIAVLLGAIIVLSRASSR